MDDWWAIQSVFLLVGLVVTILGSVAIIALVLYIIKFLKNNSQ
ncbi:MULTISPECIES: hypothetical protein [Bacillales]|nr:MULTISPECIES: hypothetical protein [Bacillaceae]MDO6657514.1 hypothetical protein [Anaerobacillus sp. 1_MG-2023]PFG14673.1 hypothetical protein ATG70_2911 [Bacillus sp. es.036]